MAFVDVIARKRDGAELSRSEIERFVAGAADGSIPSEQLAAALMAVCCRGMSARETAWLTAAMAGSGEQWELGALCPEAVDKHSTGGVGDTVSLVLAPLLAAVGVPVAMMAGRGLGHSQGTLDKLEAVPGFTFPADRDDFLARLDDCGAAVAAQSPRIAPADRTLYALRDVTATVPSLPLIVSSIMSKKLALGAATLVLDVKWGSGAFRTTLPEAVELAAALQAVGREAGMAVAALVTDMNQPLGPALGTACEVRATLDVLEGRGSAPLRELTVRLAEELLVLRGRPRAAAREALTAALADGSARTAWTRMVRAHGGDPDPARLAAPQRELEMRAAGAGWLVAVDGLALGRVAVDVGAGRRTRTEPLAHGAGMLVHARLGDRVEADQPLATLLLGDRAVDADELADRILGAFHIGDEPPPARPLVVGTADELV